MYIDSHCHLADPRFEQCLDAVMRRAASVGVSSFIQAGVGPADWRRQRELNAENPQILPCFGLHPWWVGAHTDEQCDAALTFLESIIDGSIALGELGIDHQSRFGADERARQMRIFRNQLQLAADYKKALVLHVVKAHQLVLEQLSLATIGFGGIVHGFTADVGIALRYVELGFCISVGGCLARPGYKKLKRAIAEIPLTSLVIESDAPDQPPPRYRGELNQPDSIHDVAQVVAKIKKISKDDVLSASARNLLRIFQLDMR